MKRAIRMTKIRWAIVIVIWLILISCPLLVVNSKQQQIPAIRTDAAVRTGIVSYVSGPATVEPRVSVDISANIMGKVTKIFVKEGQRVKKGDVLLELEQTQYLAGRDEAAAAYRTAQSSLELSRAKWETAQDVFKRKQGLYDKKLISAEQYDLARTQFEAERTEYEVARDNVTRARAALTQARDSLSKTVYVSPLDGVVTALNVEEGEFTVVGTLNTPGTVMITVADLAAMQVTAEIDETDVVDVRLGDPASVTVDAFPDNVFRGEVIEIGESALTPTLTSATEGSTSADFEVKVLLAGETKVLKPGMTATADVITDEVKSVVAVPIEALVTRTRETVEEWKHAEKGKGKKGARPPKPAIASDVFRPDYVKGVFVLEEEKPLVKRARFVPVEVGIYGERYVEIKKGLKMDQMVIAGPYQTLRKLNDGDIVRIEPEKKLKDKEEEKQ